MSAKRSSTVRRLRILVVEDEVVVAIGLEGMLAELGHEVVATAGRLDRALAAARKGDFDLAILDLNIRGQDTYAVAEVVTGRGIPLIFATGYESTRLRPPYGDGFVLQKPYMQSELREMIAAAIG
jgi:CheY-like chemotaxis protein